MKIDVKQEHLNVGVKRGSAAAVIEAAMFDAGLNNVEVSGWGSVIFEMDTKEGGIHRYSVSLPEGAHKFLKIFSGAEKIKPFSFSFDEKLFETMEAAQIRKQKERDKREQDED